MMADTERRGTANPGAPETAGQISRLPEEEARQAADWLRRGEIAAIEWLYDQYGRVAYGLAVRILHDPPAAEDVVQEAYLAVWRRGMAFDPARGSLRSWLLTIVRNRAIDQLRSRAYRQKAIGLETFGSADGVGDPEQTALMTDECVSLRRLLEKLSMGQRRTLELSYFDGLSQTEIALQMGVPLGTVKGRMRLGLGRLRIMLRDSPELNIAPGQPHLT